MDPMGIGKSKGEIQGKGRRSKRKGSKKDGTTASGILQPGLECSEAEKR